MGLIEIKSQNFINAIDLLNRLADHDIDISNWHKTMSNLMTYANKKNTTPGYLLKMNGKYIFVLLTIEHTRDVDGKKLNFVNLSSLYVEKEYQYLAGVLLNEIISKYDGYIITDTTANDDSLKIFKKLGFIQKSEGSMLKFPNLISLNTKSINKISLSKSKNYPEYVIDHVEMGCLVYEINDEKKGKCTFIVKRVKPLKQVNIKSAAFLIHCSDHHIFCENISKIMTKLMFNGIFILSIPNRSEYSDIGYVLKRETKQRISILGNINNKHIDWLYSELAMYEY